MFDHTVNVYGKTAEGFALRPIDNVGIQYGLNALNEGKLSIDKFLDLNERAGGVDRDMKRTTNRTVGDLDALTRAYQSGRIVNGAGDLHPPPSSTCATTTTARWAETSTPRSTRSPCGSDCAAPMATSTTT